MLPRQRCVLGGHCRRSNTCYLKEKSTQTESWCFLPESDVPALLTLRLFNEHFSNKHRKTDELHDEDQEHVCQPTQLQELLSDGCDASCDTVLLFLKDIPPFLIEKKHVFTFVKTCIKNTLYRAFDRGCSKLSHKINVDFLFKVGTLFVLNTGKQRAWRLLTSWRFLMI